MKELVYVFEAVTNQYFYASLCLAFGILGVSVYLECLVLNI